MTFYDNTKEDSRPWRATQDTQGQARDNAAIAKAAATVTKTTADAGVQGIIVSPATASIAVAGTQQLTATVVANISGTVVWASSDATKATVNASGLVTGVAAGTAVITASVTRTVKGKNLVVSGKATITVA